MDSHFVWLLVLKTWVLVLLTLRRKGHGILGEKGTIID